MSNITQSTSITAVAASIIDMPLVRKDGVEVRIVYDAFSPDSVEVSNLDWEAGVTLATYMDGLPTDTEWMVFLNGVEIETNDLSSVRVFEGDVIGLVVIPLGGNMKSILRIALQAAAIAVAFIPGIGWAAALAINVGIGLINSFLLTPKPPKSQESDGNSYGIDGAKNSSTEGIPYPVVYGEYRCAGNFSDVYTENINDKQYLYCRTVLNDGEIFGVSEIEVNEQPLENFRNVESRIGLGTLDQEVNDWFGRTVVQRNKSIRLGTDWTTHITQGEVDTIRFDLSFPQGLVYITKKKGDKDPRYVDFEMRARKLDPITKAPLRDWEIIPHNQEIHVFKTFGAWGKLFSKNTVWVDANFVVSGAVAKPTSAEIRARLAGSDDPWIRFSAKIESSAVGIIPGENGTIAGETDITPSAQSSVDIELPTDGEYEFETDEGVTITKIVSYPEGRSGTVRIQDNQVKALRRSIEAMRMSRGYYEVAIRRTAPPSEGERELDDCYLADIAEINFDELNLCGSANVAMRILLSEQLNGIPSFTAKVKGSILQEYDIEGLPLVRRWSANPAWIALDLLMSQERGAVLPRHRIDWPSWLKFAKYCDDNKLTFNGVFDVGSNIGDALRLVMRVGHASPIPFGTRMSVAIDCARDPVGAFNSTSIMEGTFQISYMSMADRANEFEVSYFDKNDKNKQKTLRYVDQKAVTFNEMPRKAEVTFVGIDNAEQAKVELWRMIYANRLIIRSVTFETKMEAINAQLGDVVMVTHPMMEWAQDGRLQAGSTTTSLNLDCEVTLEDGEDYSALIMFDKVLMGSGSVNMVVGNRILVPTSEISQPWNKNKIRRVSLTSDIGVDFSVIDIERGAAFDTILLDRSPTALANKGVSFWDTDVLVERDVGLVESVNGKSTVTLTEALPSAPEALKPWVFGRKRDVKHPYVLTGTSGSGIDKRRLSLIEYNEGVYGPSEVEIPIPVNRISDAFVAHVDTLLFEYERQIPVGRKTVNARVYWNPGRTVKYAGADVFMSRNGSGFQYAGTASGAAELTVPLSPGDTVQFKAVAFNAKGIRAPDKTAPLVSGTISVVYAELDEPLNFAASSVSFQADGKAVMVWEAPEDTTGIAGYEVQYRQNGSANWLSSGTHTAFSVDIPGLRTGSYQARIRSTSEDQTSIWVYTTFTVVVTPGSLMQNWLSSNDRNGDPIDAPTLPSVNSVEHTLNTDGSANLTFEWIWGGVEHEIDGFKVVVERTDPP